MTRLESVLLSHIAILPAQRHQYLSSNQFKIIMTHVVKELAAQVGGASPR